VNTDDRKKLVLSACEIVEKILGDIPEKEKEIHKVFKLVRDWANGSGVSVEDLNSATHTAQRAYINAPTMGLNLADTDQTEATRCVAYLVYATVLPNPEKMVYEAVAFSRKTVFHAHKFN